MNEYRYKGPVMKYGTCVENSWEASTYAVSEQKARSNLAYQYKKKNGFIPSVKITLPGEIVIVQ